MRTLKVFSLPRKLFPPGPWTHGAGWNRGLPGLGLVVWLLFVSCSKVEDVQPKGTFETGTGPLPEFRLALDSNQLQGKIRFDSIAEGGNFTLKFTPLRFGSIRIGDEGKSVEIQMQKSNWLADSTRYTVCKNGVCREGEIKIRNLSWIKPDTTDPTDTACIQMATRIFYLPFAGTIEINGLFPSSAKGTLESLRADFYTVSSRGDSVLRFTGSGGFHEQLWAWDTIRYSGQTLAGRCVKGKIALILGDTCEATARDDDFFLPGGGALWPESALTANDASSCSGNLGSFITRTDTVFDYGNFKVMATPAGILTDTLVGGNQYYKYRRTVFSLPQDGFYYYFKNNTTGRVTKAWVRIRF